MVFFSCQKHQLFSPLQASCTWNMQIVKVLGVLLLFVNSVTPSTQMCYNPDENAYSIITCGAPGKNGLPGINGTNGEKGERGETGTV